MSPLVGALAMSDPRSLLLVADKCFVHGFIGVVSDGALLAQAGSHLPNQVHGPRWI
jgi:hypothetical protein